MFSGGIFKEMPGATRLVCWKVSKGEVQKYIKKERKQVEARSEYYIQSKQQ
jgi:hypothetical protein